MTEQEIKALLEKVGDEVKEKNDALKTELEQGFITAEKFQELSSELLKDSVKAEDLTELKEGLEKMGLDIKKMAEQKEKEAPKTIREQTKAQFKAMREALDDGKKSFTMSFKTNVTSASITDDSQGVYLPGFNRVAHKGLVLENVFPRFPLPSNHHGTIYYVDETTTTRNAANKAEAAAAPESAIAWTQRSLGIGKILDSIPITHEAMMDIDMLVPEVENFINLNIALKVQENLWDGNGTLPNWKGIYTYSTDFSQALVVAGITAGTVLAVSDASLYDLIVQISTYISNGKESKYTPDIVIMNPVDINKYKLKKDANNNYLLPPFVSADGMMIDGIRVIECSEVTANTMAMGDSRHVRYYDVEGIDLEFGLDSDDFTKDLVTLKGRKRGNLLLKTADATAWYKVTDIDTRIADITA
jgi:HK97 family phage major capsid protein